MAKGLYKRHLQEKMERRQYEESLPITRVTNNSAHGCNVEHINWTTRTRSD